MAVDAKLDAWWVALSASQKLNTVKAAGQNAKSGILEYLAACQGWTAAEIAATDAEIVTAANGLKAKMQALVNALTTEELAFLNWKP